MRFRACPAVALAALLGAPSLLLAQRTVTISPADTFITAPTTCQLFSAQALNRLGNPVPNAAFVWTVSNLTEFKADSATGQVCLRGSAAAGGSKTSVTAQLIGTNAKGTTTLTAMPAGALTAVAAQPIAPRLPPGAAPVRVRAEPVSPVSASISWSVVAGASGYTVARSTSPGGPFNLITSSATKPDVTSFKDVTLTPTTTYYWMVSAQHSNAGQGSSAPVSATTPAPKNPPNFTAKAAGFNELILSWTLLPDAYYWLQGDGLPARRVDDTTFKLTGLEPGQRNFSLIAYYTSGSQTFGDEDNLSRASGAAVPPNAIYKNSLWLAMAGIGDGFAAAVYYSSIGAIPHKDTFTKWKLANGFPAQGAAKDEVRARYFNAQDLNLGRDTHCRASSNGLACYQGNSGPSPGSAGFPDPERALAELVNGLPSFATVAMDEDSQGNVNFYAYNNANDSIVTFVVLDSEGPKAVPNACSACHGGYFNVDTRTKVRPASFLPFDVFGFKFANAPGFSLADQQEDFRRLNLMVRNSAPLSSYPHRKIVAYIDGTYGGKVGTPGATASDAWVPQGWVKKPDFYHVFKRTCRTCHLANSYFTEFDFMSYEEVVTRRNNMSIAICRTRGMPNAEATYRKFWEQTNPYLPAIWADPQVLGIDRCFQ